MENNIIVFDMGGVIIDSIELTHLLTKEKYPGSTREESQNLFKGNFYQQLELLVKKYGTLHSRENRRLLIKYAVKKVEEAELFDGISELLKTLQTSGYTLSINSSAKAEDNTSILKRLEVFDLFDSVLSKEDSASKVEKFKMIAKKYDIEPSQLLFITDSVRDLEEAQELSINTIVVTYGIHPKEYFLESKCSNIVSTADSVGELESAIKEYFKDIK